MKKIFLFAGLLFTAFAFNACSDDEQEWADPQAYGQEENLNAITANVSSVIDAIDYNGDASDYVLLNTNSVDAPENTVIKFTGLKLGDIDIPVTSDNEQLYVNVNDLNKAVESYFKSRQFTEREITLTPSAIALLPDGTAMPAKLIVNDDSESFIIKFTTKQLPDIANEAAYYYVGGYNSWNLSATPMTDNGDGTFSIVLTVGDNEYFCFAPASAAENADWNSLLRAPENGYTPSEGFFCETSDNNNSFLCEKGGTYKFTISPKDWTYSYAPYAQTLFFSGDGNGWNFGPMVKVGGEFQGYYYIYKPDHVDYWGFKFETIDNWDDPNRIEYGAGEDDFTFTQGGGNIELPDGYETGFYKISANTETLTYSLQQINSLSIIGSAVNGDSSWNTDYDLTYNTQTRMWEGTYTLTDGEFKIRADHDWSLSWGGDINAMTSQNGGNIGIKAGTYYIQFAPNCDGYGVLKITEQKYN